MRKTETDHDEKHSVSLRLGGWFEAQGTGWGVLAVPMVLLVLALLFGAHVLHA